MPKKTLGGGGRSSQLPLGTGRVNIFKEFKICDIMTSNFTYFLIISVCIFL